MKQTDLEQVKNVAKTLFMAVPIEPYKEFKFLCQHPFTTNTSGVKLVGEFPQLIDYTTKEGFEEFKNQTFDMIDKAKDLFGIVIMLNKAYYMTFLKFVEPYLSKADFSKTLNDCWVQQEYPNRDKNVSHRTLIKWFRNANKKHLMEKEDFNTFNKLKSICATKGLTLYRGVEYDGKPNGLSWTTDKEKAVWFSKRFKSDTSKVYQLTITNPDNILAYFNDRTEQEVIIDTIREKGWKEVYE